MSQVYLVDGQQLTPASFGEFDTNNIWRPKEFSSPSAVGSTPTIAFVDSATSSSTATTYTFSSMGIGTASSGREILVGVSGSGTDVTLNSVTVGGVAGTFVAHQDDAAVSVSLYRAAVPTGTTADVVVVFSSNKEGCGAATYECTDLPTFPYDVIGATTASSTANRTLTVNVPANGTVMGFIVWDANPVATTTWTGITETFDDQVKVNNAQFSGAMDTFDTAQAVTMTMDPSGSNAQNSRQLAVSWGIKAAGYGTNGIFLDFADSSDLGNDVSGNNNDYTSSGLAANDQFSDTPTNNWCILNSINRHIDSGATVLSDGGLVMTHPVGNTGHNGVAGNIFVTSGKWYFEVTFDSGNANEFILGLCNTDWLFSDHQSISSVAVNAWTLSSQAGVTTYDGTNGTSLGAFTTGDVIQVAFDMDTSKLWFGKNNTYYLSGDPAAGTDELTDTLDGSIAPVVGAYKSQVGTANFGAVAFTHTPPSGFNAINTANLPTPTILDGTKNFQTTLYTGNGSTRNIDQTGNSTFQPDLVWIKNRSTTDDHKLIDIARGVTKEINSDSANLQATDTDGLTSFDSDGFGLGTGAGGYNDDTESFVAWQWLAGGGAGSSNEDGTINTTTTTVNTTAGFSCSTYTGNGTDPATIGHGLGSKPKMIIGKSLSDEANSWRVGFDVLGWTKAMYLNTNAAPYTLEQYWNNTDPTSTVWTTTDHNGLNGNTFTYVVYCFIDVEGFSKFGLYTGNGAADGPVIQTGFKPAYVMIKKTSSTGNFFIYDNQRSPYNEIDDQLQADTTTAETTGSEEIDFLSNGFKCRTADTGINVSSGTYVFAAFAEYPFGGEDVTPATAF